MAQLIDSPARNTRSHTRTEPPFPALQPAHTSPRAQRPRAAKEPADLSDRDAWAYPDKILLANNKTFVAVQRLTRSDGNRKFTTISTSRWSDDGSPDHLIFVFTCREHPETHQPHRRKRMATGTGTGNLKRSIDSCEGKHPRETQNGANHANHASSSTNPTSSLYTPAGHRALIAIRCARRHRPANMVADPEYLLEVEMLRPGTIVPSPSTVARDIKDIYLAASAKVKDHFKDFDGVVHIQVDGWQSPLVTLFMGVILIWYEGGKIWRVILEFCRLTSAHTGNYMGDLVHDLLFFAPCMDNASVCDKTVKRMAELNKSFAGMTMRLRCWAHIINLIAKAFIAIFFETPPKSAIIKAATGKRKRDETSAGPTAPTQHSLRTRSMTTPSSSTPAAPEPAPEDITEPEIIASNEDQALFPVSEEEFVDPGRVAHDIDVVTEAVSASTAQQPPCSRSRRTPLSPAALEAQKRMAISIFPKVAGLARRVHDSSTLGERFLLYVRQDRQEDPESLPGQKTMLNRRVPTRWNSDLAALSSHVFFERQVHRLTASDTTLQQFALSDEQWILAKELTRVLQIFREPTEYLSQSETPLIHEVLPLMESLIQRLKDVEAQQHAPLHEVTVLAARAALVVAEKYFSLARECDIYEISLVLCPDKRLGYFRTQGSMDIPRLRNKCISGFKRFNPTPATTTSTASESHQAPSMPSLSNYASASVWALSHSYTSGYTLDEGEEQPDSIEAYLDEPATPKAAIAAAGGLLCWWESQRKRRPNLTRMALAYLTAPATSVDAERAFSEGRLSVNHLQHNLAPDTFRAKMAIGSSTT
ncbi:hypothetical protein FRC01_008939, partial [Tulasnella sp. 417]